ncbi:Phosphate starvation-inducible protein PhoH [Mycobacterium intermedium]
MGFLGSADENLRALESLLNAKLHVRGNTVTMSGEPADAALAERAVSELVAIVSSGQQLTPEAVRHSVAMLVGAGNASPAEVLTLDILSRRGKTIRPKTLNQKHYVDAIDANTIVFGIGPAGTGKTYLAMAKAVHALQTKKVTRIILTRPAVEAGERLGFLPGTLSEKIDPYLRPLYDALYDMMDPEVIPKLMAAGVIEVAPLAYMRGRAQPLHAKVLTPNGFRPIGDLRVGDSVIGSDGRPTAVLGVYPQGYKEIYRVFTQDGSSTLASGDHLWSVYPLSDRADGQGGTRRLRVLQTKEMIGNLQAAHGHRYELPLLSAPVSFDPRPVSVDPYELGSAAGGSATEFVPEDYLFNSPDVRLAVLQGLLDSHGGALSRGDATRIEFTTTSDRLRADVMFLVQSLGGVAHEHRRSDAGTLDIRLPEGIVPFRHVGKVAAYDATAGGRPRRFVDRIESAGTEEAVCIQVAAADSLYVTEDFLLTHNTLNDAFIVLDEAQNTTAEQMKMFLTRLGFGSKVVVTGDVTQIDLPGGAQSGLRAAVDILDDIDDIHIAQLTSADVVRHRLVGEIVDAYARYEENGSGVNRAARRASAARSRR